MSVLPRQKLARIEFCEGHVAPWTASAVAIGTTAAAVAAFESKTETARAAYEAQKATYQAAKAATNNYRLALLALTDSAADILKQIKAQAAIDGDGVYTLAQIPPPATPAPKAPPGQPSDLKLDLLPDGSLKLLWKCENPAGTTGTLYHVYRQIGAEGNNFIFLGGAGEKNFTDISVPAGAGTLVYKIQAVRTTAIGVAAEFIVRLGVGSSGEMTASVTPKSLAKLAA